MLTPIFSRPKIETYSWSNSYITLGEYNVEDILPLIGKDNPKVTLYGFQGEPYKVKVSSNRLQVFQRSLQCVGCPIDGNVFLLQTSKGVLRNYKLKSNINCFIEDCGWCYYAALDTKPLESPHLNLWHRHRNNTLSLMTQDHIHPRSKGGLDNLDNLQTMCRNCNNKKADKII